MMDMIKVNREKENNLNSQGITSPSHKYPNAFFFLLLNSIFTPSWKNFSGGFDA